MFLAFYPARSAQCHALGEPAKAILSAIIFNALIIIALIPLALKRRLSRRRPAAAARQPADLLSAASSFPLSHQGHRPRLAALAWLKEPHHASQIRPAILLLLLLTAITGLAYPPR